MTSKIAFIHYAKVAGRYIDYYLQERVFNHQGDNLAEQNYKTFNSWLSPFLLDRDWHENELLQLSGNRHPAQLPTPDQVRVHHQRWNHDYLSRQYVHNHHHKWSLTTVQEFYRNGWLTFMFIREPADLICSLWTWVKKSLKDNEAAAPIKPARLGELSLNQFIKEIIGKPEFHPFFALPEYIDAIEYVAEFTHKNFQNFLQKYFDHCYYPESTEIIQQFISGNLGYATFRNQGLISDEVHNLLNNNQQVCRVRERLTFH
jgi:hypothetical protein